MKKTRQKKENMQMHNGMITETVSAAEASQRIDKWVSEKVPDLTRSAVPVSYTHLTLPTKA